MAAGFLISRILLLCLISDVHRSLASPRAWHPIGKKQMQNYGNRRPLDYIWHLRRPSVNLHSLGQVRTRQPPKKSLLRDLSLPSLRLMQTQVLKPLGSQLMSQFQPEQLRNHQLAQPRSLQINVDIPFLNLDEQNEKIDYNPDGFDTEPTRNTDQMKGGSNTLKSVPEKTVFAKDPYQRKTSDVSKSTILFNFSIPLSASSLKPLKSNVHVEKPQTPLNMYVPNKYAELAKQDQSSTQTGSKWSTFNQATQEPVQTGSKWPTYNKATQEQSLTGSQWSAYNQATQETVKTGSQWPTYNQATQETVKTGSQWPTYNQATQEPVQTGSQWPTCNQATQEPVQTGSQWPTYNQATQGPVQTGSQWPTYNHATQEPVHTESQWPTYNQVKQQPSQTGSQWPTYNQPNQEQSQTGYKWPSFNQVTQQPSQTESQWSAYNQETQEPVQIGSQSPTYNQPNQEQSQTGSQWPTYNQAEQQPSQTGSQWPTYNQAEQQSSQTGSQWPTYNQAEQQPSQTGSQWPTYNQPTQEQSQTGSQWPTYSQATLEQSQTGSEWPSFNQATHEPLQTGSHRHTYNQATQEQSQTESQWPTKASQEPSQTGSKWSTNNQVTQEPAQTGFKWPALHQSKHGKTQKQTGYKFPFFSQAGSSSQKQTYEEGYMELPNKPAHTWRSNQNKNPVQANLEKPARQPWGHEMQSTKKPSLPILKYFENLDFHRPQTSLGNRDFVIKPDFSKLLSSPFQFGSNPSNADYQSSFGNPGTDVKEESMEQGGQDQKVSSPTIKLGFTFPVLGKLPNITQSNGGYVVNIKPENTGSFSEVAQSPQSGSKWPTLSFEAVQQKPNEQTEKKWPWLNFDNILQNKQPEPVRTPPTSGKHSSWNSYQQVNEDNTPSGQSWGFQTSEMSKPQSPVLPVSKYQELIDPERTLKDKDRLVQPNPSQPEAVESQHYNPWFKPGSNDNQGQIRHSGSRLTFTIKHDDLFKAPFEPLQPAETEHNPSFNFQSVDFSKLDASPANSYEAKKPQKWQKPIFPNFHPYNSGQETPQSPISQSISYETPKKSPGQDAEHNLDGRGKYVKLSITAEGAADAVDGQTSFPSHSSYNEYPGKWDAAGTALNLQSPPCESSSSNSEQDSFKESFNPSYQSTLQSGTSNVARKPQKSYNIQVNYSPSAEKTVSVPAAFQHVLSGSVSHPIQSLFHNTHNNDQRQQSAQYNQPQNHVPVRSSWQ